MTNIAAPAVHLRTTFSGDTKSLIALAERVEQAQGPDRLLDAEIAAAVLGFIELPPDWEGGPVGYGYICEEGWMVSPGHGGDQLVPEFTKSLDQVMRRLVPEGCGWLAGWGQTRPDEPMGGARITRNARFIGHHADYDAIADSEAATPALALTAAALRAHAAMGVE